MDKDHAQTARWYEDPLVDGGVAISARVRFARNFEKYPFPLKINAEDARAMTHEATNAITRINLGEERDCRFYDLSDSPPGTLAYLMERHIISNQMVSKDGVKGVALNQRETVSVMLNEEDHVRIQAIFPGDNIDGAFETANRVDSLIETNGPCAYAFDKDYGYLTACPTNAGTGMRASLMLHLPVLEAAGYFGKLIPALGKFGMTVRGIHGEGSESLGAVYQLSNQITLGKTEEEIVTAVKSAATQVIAQENHGREHMLEENRLQVEDRLYRSYGILKNCRSLNMKEGMSLLSDVRLGYLSGVYTMPKPNKTIYALMMDIQPGSLMFMAGQELDSGELDACRADYIRKTL